MTSEPVRCQSKVIFSFAAAGLVCGETQSLYVSSRESVADCIYDGIVVGKEDPAFLGDSSISDPDGEFTAAAFD